jgi:hypothetical protein
LSEWARDVILLGLPHLVELDSRCLQLGNGQGDGCLQTADLMRGGGLAAGLLELGLQRSQQGLQMAHAAL